jgi:hypothetical protein
VKNGVLIFGAITCAAMGFVLGAAFFDESLSPPATYGKRWFFVTVCISALFVAGLITEYLREKFRRQPSPLQTSANVRNFRQSIEDRFRGDRTEEEYRRAENGVIVLVVIVFLVGMLLIIGIWAIAPVVIFLGLATLFETYDSFKWAAQNPARGAIIAFISGVFYGLFTGYALPIWSL